ncbi:serine protease [Bradyrhizobium prioriisuperbiae]|uniref:serine protease n=1 Tax=Bradyrhizobium prioriisuperbiae TaxID=2854389 RepID=UPI0028E9C1D2|nr:serine protease [Bradyrhizobium prioritasuperba]
MRTMTAAALIVTLTSVAALAQTPTAGAPSAAKPAAPAPAASTAPKPVKTTTVRPDGTSVPARPTTQTPVDTANAMAAQERQAIQSDLAWVGAYNGAINGEASERLITAIKTFQKDNSGKTTGVLNPQERAALAAAAKALQDAAGWKIGLDPVNGIRLGLPTKLAPVQSATAAGTKWSSAQGQIQIETWRNKDTNLTIAAMADSEKKEPAGRRIDYSVVKPDFFVLSGLQGLKKFYVRGQIKGSEVRGITILYDQATEGSMAPVVIAMSSAFAPFSGSEIALTVAPPPRKKVEYATGIVVSKDGGIVTDRNAVDGCETIVIPGRGNADRLRDDQARELALLRVYGSTDWKPVGFGGAWKSEVTVTGIADPQNQGGGGTISSMAAHLTSNGGDVKLAPAPGVGFSGAAVTDADGKFAGLALLKSAVVAGPTPVPAQAALVPAEIVRTFLTAAKVTVAAGLSDAKASVVRVICIRK